MEPATIMVESKRPRLCLRPALFMRLSIELS